MSFDPRQMKRIEREGYNLIGARYAVGAPARDALVAALIEAAELAPGQRVLDLAAGPGLLAAAARQKVGADGTVIASDIAEAQLACCPEPPRAAADGEHLPFASACFDRVLCGLGLMVFPDTARVLAEVKRVLAPGGMLTLSVWGRAEETPLLSRALACMKRLLPQPRVARPSVFRFGTEEALTAPLAAAGYADIRIVPVGVESRFPDAASYWQAFLDLAGGAAGSLARLPIETRQKLAIEVAHELAPHATTTGYAMTSRALVATAHKL